MTIEQSGNHTEIIIEQQTLFPERESSGQCGNWRRLQLQSFSENICVSELIPILIRQGTNNTNMQNYRQGIT